MKYLTFWARTLRSRRCGVVPSLYSGPLAALLFVCTALAAPAQDSVLITEFMAMNSSTLRDQYGAYQDWIEVYNAGSNTVNLAGWSLTDDPANLTKWRFPATNLPAFGFLVVFASGTSQTNPSAPLSTNFRLSGGGEYLALVRPDGVTIASQYSPVYPPQVADISYGLGMEVTTNTLLWPGENSEVFVPAEDIGAGWQQAGFDDSNWLFGQTGIGFDWLGSYFGLIWNDIGSFMRWVNPSAYVRVPFDLASPGNLKDLRLCLLYDDGFVAYLNGHEVARRNAPATLSWNSAATASHGLPFPADPTFQDFDGPGASYYTRTFSGNFSPALMPPDSGSTGKFLRLANTSASVLNTIVFDRTATGPFNTIVATFDFRMTGSGTRADGLGFALLPTSIYGSTGPAAGPFTGFGEEPNLPGAIGVGLDIYQNTGEINNNHVSLHFNGSVVSRPVASPSFDLANGNFHRAEITISFADGKAFVTVVLTANINSSVGPSQTLFDNFVIPGVLPYEARAAFGARTGGANANHDLDNINIQFVPPSTLDYEEFDLKPFVGALLPGRNVLAIQGLNVSADDPDFLILPELISKEIKVLTNSPGYFADPTPGAPNAGGAPQLAPSPQFLTPGGNFAGPVSVEIGLPGMGAEIRYTLDGSEPVAASPLYTGPILLSASATIRARAFGPRMLPSGTVSQTYTLVDNDLQNFNSNLPLVIIDTFARTIVPETKIPATMTFIDTFRGRSSALLAPDLQVRAGIEIRGQSSTQFPKKSYGFETWSEMDKDLNVPLLGLPSGSDWVLYAPYTDKTLMNDFLAYELHEKMGHYAVRRRFVEVFVHTSNSKLSYAQDYAGIYVLLEKIKIEKNRLDLAKLQPGDNSEPDISGGYIFKKDKDSPGDVSFSTSIAEELLKFHDPPGEDLTAAQRGWLVNYIDQFEQALYAPNWTSAAGTNHYSYYIDVDSFVDQHWIVEYTKNIDGYRLSDFFHKDRNGKIFMDPIWDWNLAFGNANYLQGWQTNGWYYAQNGDPPGNPISDYDHIWLRQLVGLPSGSPPGDPDFSLKIADRWEVLRTNIFATSNVLARVDELASLLSEAQTREFQRWPRLGAYIWPNPDDYWPIATYQGTVDWMKRWIEGRFEWIDSQYPLRAPAFNHPGGMVSPGFYCIISASDPVYFTMDGTDPRLPQGSLSPRAMLYAAPFPITSNALVVARIRTANGTWGPLAKVGLFTQIPSLAITEMMYHPQTPPAGSPYTASDFEYVELKNTGAAAVNLRNFQFTGGIHFVFPNLVLPAGQQLVIVRNKAAFQSQYGPNISVAGEFSGSLNNSGDHLLLLGAFGELIQDVSYQPDWCPLSDGLGFSLVRVRESAPLEVLSSKSSWRASNLLNGSPGRDDGPSSNFPPIFINEVLTHPQPPAITAIELYNGSNIDVDIGGWFLSDDMSLPKKFRCPPHSIVPAHGFRVFDERDFNNPQGAGMSFALSPDGGEVYLLSGGPDANLNGYLHAVSFGAQKAGVTFGRFITSSREEHFVAQNVPTLGSVNAYPRVGPVVISEIMYHPSDVPVGTQFFDNGEDEFIELRNITDDAVLLYDPAHPANGWRLGQAVEYTFPEDTVIPPGSTLLVVSFDPVINPDQLDAFAFKYGVDPSMTPIFGPYSGKLNNSGETLELKMPDAPDSEGIVPYVIVDRVHYEDHGLWPAAADGAGFSLQRVELTDYGDDPGNWTAGPPTPGQDLVPATAPGLLTQPHSISALAGTDVTLSVAALGIGPFHYQWRFQGENIPGATDPSLALNQVQSSAAGAYQVVVLGPSSSTLSAPAVLTVVLPIRIISPAQPSNVRLTKVTDVMATNILFTVSVLGGSPALQYQWRFNGADIPEATNATYTVSNVSVAKHGPYQVLVYDAFTSALSEPGNLNVLVTPTITQPWPAITTAAPGDNVTWSVSASGFPLPFTFLLRRGTTIVSNITLYATNCSFTLRNVQPSDAAFYRAFVTNSANAANPSVVSSTVSTLQVLADTDHDGIPDDWETRYGFMLNDPTVPNGDPDHDGMANWQEYLAGTNPTNATSVLKLAPLTVNSGAILHFTGMSNRTYTIQFKNTLRDPIWSKLTDLGARSTNWPATALDPTTNRSRYYRVVTPSVSP